MADENVGAGILNIITESLYDKPVVVFREYVQNSIDSFLKINNEVDEKELLSKIWLEKDNLYFLDNGGGIGSDKFEDKMKNIGFSEKSKHINMGYKGIGRLSGIPYCKKLIFINICSYTNNIYQMYSIDGMQYNQIKKSDQYKSLTFNSLMDEIGKYTENLNETEQQNIKEILDNNQAIFEKQDTGFIVILEQISTVLKRAIQEKSNKDFFEELGWLLPVSFKDELFRTGANLLFQELQEGDETSDIIPARAFNVFFNDQKIERPISESMIRDYICKCDFKYAVGFQSFNRKKISVDTSNSFSGIKIYIDNMFLCDEKELLPMLQQYGLIDHTANELIQSVKGIGAMIYITDKVNISANARRTFIEVTDSDSLEFLRLLALFVKKIYNTRYALSKYASGRKTFDMGHEKLDQLKQAANEALQELAEEKITVMDEEDKVDSQFEDLSEIDKKKLVKIKISKEINKKIKTYLGQATSFDYDNAYKDFKTWLSTN